METPPPKAAPPVVVGAQSPEAPRETPEPPVEPRTAYRSNALAGAWIEQPTKGAPRPTTENGVEPAAGMQPPVAPAISRAQMAGSAPAPRPPSSPQPLAPSAEAVHPTPRPAVEPRIARRANTVHDRIESVPAPTAVMHASSPPTSRAAAAAPVRAPTPPAPSHELLVEHLDVRVITEPERAQRSPATAAPIGRAPSSLGAWRTSARRFLGRP